MKVEFNMKVHEYMIPVYATLVERGGWTIDRLPEHYKVPVAEYLAARA